VTDAQPPLQQALRLLARRPLTEHELRRGLAARGRTPVEIDAVCERLRGDGYLDDRELARDFIRLRSERVGHGPGRLLQDLERRGVAREVARSALSSLLAAGDLVPADALRAQVRRRLKGAARPGRREVARVYNALLRAGFDEELIRRELATHLDETDPRGTSLVGETDDDFR
jgi:regulatory protein